jgi:hypothetical protein
LGSINFADQFQQLCVLIILTESGFEDLKLPLVTPATVDGCLIEISYQITDGIEGINSCIVLKSIKIAAWGLLSGNPVKGLPFVSKS